MSDSGADSVFGQVQLGYLVVESEWMLDWHRFGSRRDRPSSTNFARRTAVPASTSTSVGS